MNVFSSSFATICQAFAGGSSPGEQTGAPLGSMPREQIEDEEEASLFDLQMVAFWQALQERGLEWQLINRRWLGEPMRVLISDPSTGTFVYSAIFEDAAGNPVIFVKTCSSSSAEYVVPLISAIGDASDEINHRARLNALRGKASDVGETASAQCKDGPNEPWAGELLGNEIICQYRTFIMEVDGLWVTSRAEGDWVITGHHASATIPEEAKPHSIFISSEPDELGEEGSGETHGLGYQRCGEADLIIIETDKTTLGLMRPGVQFKVTLRWRTSDNDYDIFTLVQIELEVDKA